MNKSIVVIGMLFLLIVADDSLYSQTRTVGLFINDTSLAWRGYTMLAPKQYTSTYLIDNNSRIINQWSESAYPPGQSVYLLPNGNLLRSCMIHGPIGSGGGEGGRIEEYTWDDSLVWEFDYSTANYTSHHDIRPLPNGNILVLAVEKKTYAQCIAAGFNPSRIPDVQTSGYMLPDYVIEVQPTYPQGGNIVWEWHVWDHLIQNYDSTKANYGIVASHPELIDADGDGRNLPVFWNHMNAVTYNSELNQVMMSVRGNSEVWIIDHSTTTQQAAGHSGGLYGHGGDLLYRWGNPVCYSMGNASNQKLFQQHDAQWIDPSRPGGGDILVFNNGLGRNYSTIDQFTPPVDGLGFYHRTEGSAFGPSVFTWTYTATPPSSLYATAISGAQRQPNGNTLICDGTHGVLTEVTTSGQIVWKYVNPVINTGPLYQGDTIPNDPSHPDEKMNMVFRVQRYAPDYVGLQGRDLTPGDYIEIYPTGDTDCVYLMGDINGDSSVLGGDVTYGVRFFKGTGGVPPDSCYMDSTSNYIYVAGDVNGNCEFRGSDITRLVAYFKGISALSYCHFFPTQILLKFRSMPETQR
jgi:hypothetical protein